MSCSRGKSNHLLREAQALVAHDDHVDIRIEFDWAFAGPLSLDPSTGDRIVPKGLEGPGVYRLRSGRRDSGDQFDCWYVGRTLVNVEGRIAFHASEDFDEDTRCLKQFKSNLSAADGWAEVDRAEGILVNGESALRIMPPAGRRADPAEWEAVELVFNFIEATGLAANLSYGGRASKK